MHGHLSWLSIPANVYIVFERKVPSDYFVDV